MARFDLIVDLRGFTDVAREGIKVTVRPTPDVYPVAGDSVHVAKASGVTDADGSVTFNLVSLPGLTYVVSAAPYLSARRISGDRADGTTLRLDEALSVPPVKLQPVEAAELVAAQAALAERMDGFETPSPAWVNVTGKPTTFPPAAHTHPENVTDAELTTALAAKANTGHSHPEYATQQYVHDQIDLDIAAVDEALDGKANTLHNHVWTEIVDRPTVMPPTPHGHAISDVDGLQLALDSIDPDVTWGDVTGKPATFPPSTHNHDDRYYTEAEVDARLAALPTGGGGGGALTGHGFPEGNIVAPVGTEYTDLDATSGAVTWIKTFGSGSTGWRVLYGDTGPRLIGTDRGPFPGLVSGSVYLRRIGQHVTLLIANGEFNNDGAHRVTYDWVPPGFNPTGFVLGILGDLGTLDLGKLAITDVNRAMWSNCGNGSFKVGTMDWQTSEPWPTTLPGSPA